ETDGGSLHVVKPERIGTGTVARRRGFLAGAAVRVEAGSALLPRQAGVAPAADAIALATGVAVALETLEDVVAVTVARLVRQPRRGVRASARTAHEQHQRLRVDLLPQLGEEGGIAFARRPAVPLDLDRIGHPPHPFPFGAGSHIHQPGTGGELPHLPGFGR